MKRVAIVMDNSKDLLINEHNIQLQGIQLNDSETVTKTIPQDLDALAREIEKADYFIKTNACSKLQVIIEQIKSLKKQAENIVAEADWNMKLHHVPCNFVKRPGHVYHLYQRKTGQLYFSMISSNEWGKSEFAQTYKGSYRLEHDYSWTSLREIDNKDKEIAMFATFWSNNCI
ncbi:PREDICTED: uncharacterized protein C1orf50 [Eufriesea mexicana]|uniref:uncharacterized protein C1orf50 n=1 Tax=Eufriesea mexicana TaxID=516756 RepID=UPI00083C8BD8|nr:PREDICTED: uncharacterized protein C1orf50 [Eufriesea mexicana]